MAEKALAKRPEDRYQSAMELAEEIRAYISGERVSAYEYSSWELLKHFAARQKAAVVAAALALAAIVAALGVVASALHAEHAAHRKSEFHLAKAYLERSHRHLREVDLEAARRFAAASLVHNPAAPGTEAFDERFAREHPQARALAVESASTLFQAESRRVLEVERELPTGEFVGALAFSADGRTLAACGQEKGEVRVWDAPTGALRRVFAASPEMVWVAALTEDGSLLARGKEKTGVDVWDTRTGEKRWSSDPALGGAKGLRFVAGALVVSFRTQAPHVYEAGTGRVLAALGPEHAGSMGAVTRDGGTLATVQHGKLRRWRLPDLAPDGEVATEVDSAFLLDFAPDGRTLAAYPRDHTVAEIEAATGKRLRVFKLEDEEEALNDLVFTGDGRHLLMQDAKGIQVWETQGGQLLAMVRGKRMRCLAGSPDGKSVARGEMDKQVALLRFVREPVVRPFSAHADAVFGVRFSRDGTLLATAGGPAEPEVKVWDASTLALRTRLVGHTGRLTLVEFDPKGERLASGGRDETLRVWDLARGAEVYQVALGEMPVAAQFAPDGRLLAVAGRGGKIRLFEAASGKPVSTLEGHRENIGGLAFSPDGRRLLTSSNDRTVRLWDVATGGVLKVLEGHQDWAWGAAFAPDGRSSATGSRDGEIIVWDLERGAPLRRLTGHDGWVKQVRFGPDGALVSCSDDATVRIWDVASGEVRVLLHTTNGIDSVDLSPDGARLLYGDGPAGVLSPSRLPPAPLTPAQILARDPLAEESF
ncbi:MAG: hypothetical protein QM765_05720 [Myxococcales bacterium]